MGDGLMRLVIEATVQVKAHRSLIRVVDNGEMDQASLVGQHGRALVGVAVFFVRSGSKNIFTQGETHRRVAVEHPVDLAGILLTPAVGVEERLVGRAEAIKAHPGGEGQLWPGAVSANVEAQVITDLDKLSCP